MVAVAILAAGKGTRMKSDLPKVLHSLGGRSLIEQVLHGCSFLSASPLIAIVGYQGDRVKEALSGFDNLEFVEQTQQLGTGHAVQQLIPCLADYKGDLLILNGDVPLLRPETLQNLLQTHQKYGNAATILTANLSNPQGYGRVFCDSDNLIKEIVEDRDCSPAQKQNRRINAGVYCFNWSELAKVLPHLQSNNDQQEYYLTDVFSSMSPVMAVDVPDCEEILGINDRKQLASAYKILQQRIKDKWMVAGVTIIDPDSVTIDDTVELEADVAIEPQTHLRGRTKIGARSRIGPNTSIENSEIGTDVTVMYSVIADSKVESGTRIGPYAHLRGNVQVGAGCRIGNFVELKNTTLGTNSNVAHLSYLGDTAAGNQVNIGAGTITANYDGFKKHKTVIGDRTKTGSNSVLIAPLTLGCDVTVAAGSVIYQDVGDDSLAIARARQYVKRGWRLKSDSSQ